MEIPPMRSQQATFAEASFEVYYKPTRREQFLAKMDRVVPWAELGVLIEPFYPKMVCKFRHRLEAHSLGEQVSAEIAGGVMWARRPRTMRQARIGSADISSVILL
jgi:hypothetical protein